MHFPKLDWSTDDCPVEDCNEQGLLVATVRVACPRHDLRPSFDTCMPIILRLSNMSGVIVFACAVRCESFVEASQTSLNTFVSFSLV